MVELAVAGLAIGPGSGETPGIAGDRSVVMFALVVAAAACGEEVVVLLLALVAQELRSRAPANAATSTTPSLCAFKCLIMGFP
jgi:hypothetical protein